MSKWDESTLDPLHRYRLGDLFRELGVIAQLGSIAFVLIMAPFDSIEAAAADVWIIAANGLLWMPLGEAMQWDARREVEELGETVPEAWQPDEGSRLDQAVVAILFYPLGERIVGVLERRRVSGASGVALASVANLSMVGSLVAGGVWL